MQDAMISLERFLQDLRHTLRQFRNRPGFAVAAVLVLGIGLGANTAIFSVVNGILFHAVPYADPAKLVVLYERGVMTGVDRASLSYADFKDWSEQSRSLDNIAIARENPFNLGGNRGSVLPERINGVICSWTLLPALGNSPRLGRFFTAADDQRGAARVAIISYSLWQRRFDGIDYQIVGVMPNGFSYPRAGSEAWIPVLQSISDDARTRRGWRQFVGLARLRSGFTIDQARIELDGIAQRIRTANPGVPNAAGAFVFPIEEFATRNVRTALFVLLGAVACVLLIACVNIANLLLARASGRQREMAIRSAIGASRGRIVRQLLTESFVLAFTGAVLGLLLASFVMDALTAAVPALINEGAIRSMGEVRLDTTVFLFTTVTAIAAGLGIGIVPALQASRSDLAGRLNDGNRSMTPGRGQAAFRNALVSIEVALSLVLLVAAGLLLRSFQEVQAVRPGLRTGNLLTAGISLSGVNYPARSQVVTFTNELKQRLGTLPGVRSAAISTCLPIDGFCSDQFFAIDGRPMAPGHMLAANNWSVSPEFFSTVGIPIVRGRAFTAEDARRAAGKSPYAAIINESMAKAFWPGENPIGQRIKFDDGPDEPRWEIVGVCGDVLSGLDQKPQPTYFFPFNGWATFYAVIETAGDPAALSSVVQRTIASLDADVPAFKIRTMREVADSSSSNRRFSALLIGVFAAAAL